MLGLGRYFFDFAFFYCLFVALSPDLLSSVLFTACLYTYYFTVFFGDPLNILTWIEPETGERYSIRRGEYDFFEIYPNSWRASILTT